MTLIVALDDPRDMRVVEDLCGVVEGFKVGLPLLLGVGLEGARMLRRSCSDALWIYDLKLADIGAVMVSTLRRIEGVADAVIAHGFIGLRGALDELSDAARALGVKLVLVASMSHPGSCIYDKVLDDVLGVIEAVSPWGVVAPATRPHIISRVRGRLGCGVKILSPGIGVQGARPCDALRAGADYEIIGRLITRSPSPLASAKHILELHSSCRRACREPHR